MKERGRESLFAEAVEGVNLRWPRRKENVKRR